METTLKANIELINEGIKFSSVSGDNPEIVTDYYPPFGNNEGYKPLELFLISMGTCTAGAILPFLRKMGKKITSCRMEVEGTRRTEHPTSFSLVMIKLYLVSPDIESIDMDKTIKLAEEKYCPMIAMVRNNVEVKINYQLTKN